LMCRPGAYCPNLEEILFSSESWIGELEVPRSRHQP
jgi:hypothetical protein